MDPATNISKLGISREEEEKASTVKWFQRIGFLPHPETQESSFLLSL